MAEVTYDSATCIYPGADRPAVDALQLPIKDGEFVVLVGPSGCGKTTALRMLAGLEEIDDGSIRIDGKDMVGVPSRDRDIAMVFQNYALYPSKTVGENMGFALKMQRRAQGRARPPGAGGGQAARPGAAARPQAAQPVRRAAAAGRDGPRHRPRAQGLLHGRAAVQPRRPAAGADPHPDRRAAAPPGRHHRLRDPRPGGGHDDGRSGGRVMRLGSCSSSPRPASCTTTRSNQFVAGVHRLAGDEPVRRRAGRTAAHAGGRGPPLRPLRAQLLRGGQRRTAS